MGSEPRDLAGRVDSLHHTCCLPPFTPYSVTPASTFNLSLEREMQNIGPSEWLVSISSTLFRLLAFVFLRIVSVHSALDGFTARNSQIPLTLCNTTSPALHVFYVSSLLVSSD